ncbi:hypothetical protein ACHAPD_009962 [Fusarium lateritium]
MPTTTYNFTIGPSSGSSGGFTGRCNYCWCFLRGERKKKRIEKEEEKKDEEDTATQQQQQQQQHQQQIKQQLADLKARMDKIEARLPAPAPKE